MHDIYGKNHFIDAVSSKDNTFISWWNVYLSYFWMQVRRLLIFVNGDYSYHAYSLSE